MIIIRTLFKREFYFCTILEFVAYCMHLSSESDCFVVTLLCCNIITSGFVLLRI